MYKIIIAGGLAAAGIFGAVAGTESEPSGRVCGRDGDGRFYVQAERGAPIKPAIGWQLTADEKQCVSRVGGEPILARFDKGLVNHLGHPTLKR